MILKVDFIIMNIVVIVPVYNEASFLDAFIESIINQTFVPLEVLFVDDNSTDDSSVIIKRYAKKYSFIDYCFHESGAYKLQGTKVINAFNFGLKFIDIQKVDIISKIDADLELPLNYFEKISNSFQSDERIGVSGGRILELHNGIWSATPQADYHIRGALKSYRVECFTEIGGLKPILGWDGLDEMTAFYKGWKSKIVDSDVKHFRPANSDYNKVDIAFKMGRSNYMNGGNLFLALLRTVFKIFKKKSFTYGISFLKGYLNGLNSNEARYVDDDFADFINKFHLRRIIRL
ncbi:MAG: glycosyltransferase family A protein [Algoriphagus sp.]|uniref:glycosyltransferase family 2 protein n=1 Tax=Algoriphagus sp. TaxID=1872435 RepID=UPI0026222C43|nr:glycosyltransferase family A protein [Algoriphagus sp.]MDG1278238.1 glycosyltransferase family A protein [Algoriphagus sp.]